MSLWPEDYFLWTHNILVLLVMSNSKDIKVLARNKKTLAEDSLLPLHTVAVPLTVGQSPGPTTLLTLVVSNIPL